MITGVTTDGLYPTYNTMKEVFDFSWGKDMAMYDKQKGTSGTVAITTPGAMNALYGPFIQNLAYNQHNTLALLGQKAYKTGYRFQEGLSMDANQSTGVVRGGFAPQPVYGKYVQFEMPYKTLAHRFAMNIGMVDIGEKGIDDVMTWQQQFELEGQTFLWSQNNDVLRRVEDAPITAQGSAVATGQTQWGDDGTSKEIVGLESIDRIISNFEEGKHLPAGYNVPWKLATDAPQKLPSSDSGAEGALKPYRDGTTNANADNNFNCYVDSNYTEGDQTGKATLRQLTLPMIDNMFLSVMPYWENNSTQGKVCVTGYDTLAKMQMLLQPQQRYQGYVNAQVDVNGIKTLQGQNTGFQVSTYNGTPICPDKMVNRGDKDNANAGVARIYLFDNDILFNGVLRAPTVEMSQDSIVTGRYIRLADIHNMGEVQVNGKFKGLGKIVHLK